LLRADLEVGSAERVREAYNLANAIWRAHPDVDDARSDLARTASKMGELAADRNAAAKYYGEALAQYDVLSQHLAHRDAGIDRALGTVAAKIGAIELDRGNLLAALSNFSRALQVAEALAAMEGPNAAAETRLLVADANAQVGDVLLRNGARAEGAAKLKKALAIYRELGQDDRANAVEQKLREQ
jgi:ABC-type transporter Mla subunit MlaD